MDAVARAWGILLRFGGALVADGVGLGKTFVGLGLAWAERRSGGGSLVVAPAALRGEWTRAADAVGEPLDFLSHTALAGPGRPPDGGASLLIVDEAHAFRNPRTRRYDSLARLAIGRRVVLLTATPVNNTPRDLVALIALFAGTGRFREFGVADLFAALRGDAGADASLPLAALTVCRTRRLVESRFPALRGAFPHRVLLAPARYDLRAVFGGTLERILDSFAVIHDVEGEAEHGAALLVLGLLRRLESSRAALLRTLRRHDAYLREWARARADGRRLTRREFRRHREDGDGEGQLALWPLLLDRETDPEAVVHRWATSVGEALRAAESAQFIADPKVEALVHALNGPLRGRKTIVFTEYRDTARSLASALRHRTRVLCVAGDAAWAGTERLSRREALDAFAPRARAAAGNRLLEADVLVATDVASEGMNLQDASAVVNYDLPWNPVRVMQRIGRIDRLHSHHPTVAVLHLLPDGGLHDVAGVLRTLRSKLAHASGATAEPDPLSALWWLEATGPLSAALEDESWRRVEPFEARERWRAIAGPVTGRTRPCVGACVVDDGRAPAAGVLLCIEWPDGSRVPAPFVLEPGGDVRCDAIALGALAERAHAARPLVASPADFRTALAAALPEARRRLLACSAARHGAPPQGTGRRRALRAIAARVRTAKTERDAVTLANLAVATSALAEELPAGLDRALADLCTGAPGETVDDHRLEALLCSVRPWPRGFQEGAPRLRLVAALAVASRCPADEEGPRAA